MSLVAFLAQKLVVPETHIAKMVATASHQYKTFKRPKPSGGYRRIHHPSKALKAVQRLLLDTIIARLPVHPAAMAYRRGLSSGILRNAESHRTSAFSLRMDFEDFFPSISDLDVRTFLGAQDPSVFEFAMPEDIDAFCKLVCRRGQLTIGAPTSPGLSNAISFDLDRSLSAVAMAHGATYTRYADDLFFSTTTRDVLRTVEKEVRETVDRLACPARLSINGKKTKHSSKRSCRHITGLVLGSDGEISVGRDLKRRVRAQIYRYDQLTFDEKRQLAGTISFVHSTEPDFINRLILKYGTQHVRRARKPPLPLNDNRSQGIISISLPENDDKPEYQES